MPANAAPGVQEEGVGLPGLVQIQEPLPGGGVTGMPANASSGAQEEGTGLPALEQSHLEQSHLEHSQEQSREPGGAIGSPQQQALPHASAEVCVCASRGPTGSQHIMATMCALDWCLESCPAH